jgi:broad specificity phosphatase PhoE
MNKYVLAAKYIIPALILGFVCYYFFSCYLKAPVTTIILIRHADRNPNEDQLNALGFVRAQELARILDEANISVIYATSAIRAQKTVSPLAAVLGIEILPYNPDNIQAMVNEINSHHRGKVILIVGHSNTVPATIGLLGVPASPITIPENEFDNMFIVTLCNRCKPRMIRMEYGTDTP